MSKPKRRAHVPPALRCSIDTVTSVQLGQLKLAAFFLVASMNEAEDRKGKVSPSNVLASWESAKTAVEMMGIDPATIKFSSELDSVTFDRKAKKAAK